MRKLGRRNRAGAGAHCKDAGFSLIELLIVIAIILVIAAIAIPNLISGRRQANESAAAGALRSIGTAQVSYQTSYQQGFSPDLASLGPPPGGSPPSATAADLIDAALASGFRSGYTFTYVAVDSNSDGQFEQFTLNANPVTVGVSGLKRFYMDQSNVIRFNLTGPAGPSDLPIPF
jgi:prepilin-type N-terminal cleavage/methylation domain-containing protein